MKFSLHPCLIRALLILGLLCPQLAVAQPSEQDLNAAVRVLQQATTATADGRHHDVLRGLRKTRDAELRPLYQHLASADNSTLQTHGILGLAETSPQRSLDLAALSEITDARQRVEIIGAALDDDLLTATQMSTLLSWNDLQQGARQAIAVRLIASGGSVAPSLFTPALAGDFEGLKPSQLLERYIAAAMLAQLNDPRGLAELNKLDRVSPGKQLDAVRAQVLSLAIRHDFQALGPWAHSLAKDKAVATPLREVAIRAALRLGANNSTITWQTMYREADGLAGKLRLTLIALDAAGHVSPDLFTGVTAGNADILRALLSAGKAAASQPPIDLAPVQSLIDLGYHQGTGWLIRYAENHSKDQAAEILAALIRGYDKGHPNSRNALMAIAIEASASLSELNSQPGRDALLRLLKDPDDTVLRQIVYSGLIRSDRDTLEPLLKDLPEPEDDISRDVYLVLRLRSGLDLSAKQWQRVANLVDVPGQADTGVRAELAWYQVKRAGQTRQVLNQLIRD